MTDPRCCLHTDRKVDVGGLSRLGMTLRRGERATPEDAFMMTPFKTAVPNAGRPYPGILVAVNKKIQDVGPLE